MEENKMELSSEQFEQLLKKERANGRGQGIIIGIAAIAAFLLIAAGTIFITYRVITGKPGNLTGAATNEKLDKLWGMMEDKFLWDEDIDKELAQEYMYKGLVSSLGDKYSTYYTKAEFKELLESFEGEYSGIGAYVTQNVESGRTYIASPMPGSPAEKAGLLPDDEIVSVNGEAVAGLDLNVIVSKIKGPEGTKVDIEILREDSSETQIFTVERRTIEVIRVTGKMLDDNIGYILISDIEESTVDQFKEIYGELKDDGMEGLVLDLRDNPGGDLDAVIKLADIFLDEGIVVYTEDKKGKRHEYKSDKEQEIIPLVVLVNANTASAAEILSGSLKERGVAVIVGTQTFGKGIVQSIYPLIDGSGLKLTESEYFLEHDTKIHGIGVIPDVELELDKEANRETGADNQLDKAIEILKGEIK